MKIPHPFNTLATGIACVLLGGSLHAQQPNIILILADDLGYDDIGCYGNTLHETPNIDSLASAGIKLTRHYSAAAICSPTRASLMTGNFPARLHITETVDRGISLNAYSPLTCDTDISIQPDWLYLPQSLKDLGYDTGFFGKWHLERPPENMKPADVGFTTVFFPTITVGSATTLGQYGDNVFNNDNWGAAAMTQQTVNFMQNAVNANKPFFAYVSHNLPHVPWGTTTALFNKYTQKIAGGADGWQGATYAGMIEQLDDSVGVLLDWLDQPQNAAVKANTLVIFTSDNGPIGPSGNIYTLLNGAKLRPFEGGIRVPFLATWPNGIPAGNVGTVRDELVVTADYFPTFHAMAGGDPGVLAGEVVDGESFLPLLLGNRQPERSPLVFHFPLGRGPQSGGWSALIDWPYKYIYYWEGSLDPYWFLNNEKENFLFHLGNDPLETTNLKDAEPAVADAMKNQLMTLLADHGAQIPIFPVVASSCSEIFTEGFNSGFSSPYGGGSSGVQFGVTGPGIVPDGNNGTTATEGDSFATLNTNQTNTEALVIGTMEIDLGTISAAGVTYTFTGDFGWRFNTVAVASDLAFNNPGTGFLVDGVGKKQGVVDVNFGEDFAANTFNPVSFSYTTVSADIGNSIGLRIQLLDQGAETGLTSLITDNWVVTPHGAQASGWEIPVGNASFETLGNLETGRWWRLPAGGAWVDGNSGNPYEINNTFPIGGKFERREVPEGIHVMNLSGGSPLTQNLSHAVSTGDQITLRFWLGTDKEATSPVDMTAFLTLDGLDVASGTFSCPDATGTGVFELRCLSWTATDSGNLGLKFTGANGTWLDNVSVQVVPSDVLSWADSYGEPGLVDFSADSDGDGKSNEYEYLWGLDPTDASSSSPILGTIDSKLGTFSYTRRNTGPTAASYTYQWSDSLTSWNPLTPSSESSDATNPVETVTVTLDAALLAKSKLFIRVVAER